MLRSSDVIVSLAFTLLHTFSALKFAQVSRSLVSFVLKMSTLRTAREHTSDRPARVVHASSARSRSPPRRPLPGPDGSAPPTGPMGWPADDGKGTQKGKGTRGGAPALAPPPAFPLPGPDVAPPPFDPAEEMQAVGVHLITRSLVLAGRSVSDGDVWGALRNAGLLL